MEPDLLLPVEDSNEASYKILASCAFWRGGFSGLTVGGDMISRPSLELRFALPYDDWKFVIHGTPFNSQQCSANVPVASRIVLALPGAEADFLAAKENRNLPRAHFPLTPHSTPSTPLLPALTLSAGECKVSGGKSTGGCYAKPAKARQEQKP